LSVNVSVRPCVRPSEQTFGHKHGWLAVCMNYIAKLTSFGFRAVVGLF